MKPLRDIDSNQNGNIGYFISKFLIGVEMMGTSYVSNAIKDSSSV